MMSGPEIRQAIEDERLVIDPLPADLDQLGVSIDCRLHDMFWKSAAWVDQAPAGVDVTIDVAAADPYEYSERIQAAEIVVPPKGFILGETAEKFGLADDICGWIEGKSGRARQGLVIHLTAPKIDPGWGDLAPKRITLEIVNHLAVPVRLKAGIPIAQMMFFRLAEHVPNYTGKHLERASD